MEITRAQKRLILMIVDTIIIYMSGYIAYFFLSEYIQTRELNIIQNQTYVKCYICWLVEELRELFLF